MVMPIAIGPQASGKTEVSRILARELDVPLVDADVAFANMYGPITTFVNRFGQELFRQYEAEILTKIVEDNKELGNSVVLAPGGGAVAHDQGEEYRLANIEALQKAGRMFYLLPSKSLEESARVLTDRWLRDPNSAAQRISLNDNTDKYGEILETVRKRDPLYREASENRVIYTDGLSVHHVAEEVLSRLR